MQTPAVQEFFDPATSTLTYVVFDPRSKDAVVIDPVWDYDPASSKLSLSSLYKVTEFITAQGLRLHLILETHAHADHVTGAQPLKVIFPAARVGIGSAIAKVQATFKKIYNLPESFSVDGSQFDLLMSEDRLQQAGSLSVYTIATPGHTPACVSYAIGSAVFTGDVLFMPDSGTGRCDFPDGSARELYASVHGKLYALPDEIRLFTGHDYQPGGRALKFMATVAEQKRENDHIKAATTLEEFVQFREARDKTLSAPKLLLPSLQINIRAGHLPEPEGKGMSYLKIPIQGGN